MSRDIAMNATNNGCPSKFDLAHWAAQSQATQSPADAVAQHISTCGRCHAYVDELAEARVMLLGGDPARASLNAARTILAAAEDRRRSFWRFKFLWPVALLPAAALVGVFALVDHTPNQQAPSVAMNTVSQSTSAAPSVRAKGSFALTIVCKRGESMFTVADGDGVRQGDRLRFEYTQAQPGFLMVFSVDDAGVVFPYYDEASLRSVAAVAGNQIALPGSVELDAHKGLERVFALWSASPLGGDDVRNAVTKALAQAAGDLRGVQKLPIEAEQTSYLLVRP